MKILETGLHSSVRKGWVFALILWIPSILAGPTVAAGGFVLDVEVNPDPVEPGQPIEAQIMVTNTGGSTSGNLTLQVLWPAELNVSPVATDGGSCPGSCNPGEFLSWNLGTLGAGATRVVGFSEFVFSGVSSGTVFDLETDLLEDGSLRAEVDHSVEVEADSPLEVFVDPLMDPAPSGGTLVYEITYGNESSSAAESSELRFPIPSNTQFLTATGGGTLVGDDVVWSLGSVTPSSGGSERVVLQVDPVAAGTHLRVDAATFTGDVVFQPKSSRAMAVSRVGSPDLAFAMEVNPDPLEPGQSMDVQLLITNPTGSVSGNLTLRVLWPEELNVSPVVTGGGGCPGSCNPGEYLFWDLGVLGPGASIALGFSEFVFSGVDSGRAVPLEAELFEGGLPSQTQSRTTLVLDDSPLEVFVDPLFDPVSVGSTLTYELNYGNSSLSSVEGAEMRLPIPWGAQFLSATEGGTLVGDEVVWNLGTVGPSSGGRARVTVQVLPMAAEFLVVDAAVFQGDLNFQPKRSRGMAVSRVGAAELAFAMEVNPDPVEPGQSMDIQMVITNPTASATGNLTLRALWPEELNVSPVVTAGGGCPGSCNTGEYLFWDLGVLGPGASLTTAFSEFVFSGVASGRLVPLEVELFEGGAPAGTLSRTTLVQDDSPLEVFVDPLVDPIPAGQLLYEISFGNSSNSVAEDAELRFPVPRGTEFVSATGGGMVEGDEVVWNLGNLASQGAGRYEVVVELNGPESHLVVDSAVLQGALVFQERTARAMAVSRVGSSEIALTLDIGVDPVSTSGIVSSLLTVINNGGSVTGGLTLRVLWPEELNVSPTTSGGGSCPGSCNTGEYLFWELGSIGPGVEFELNFSENVFSAVGNGRLVPLEVELLEGGLPSRTVSHTVLVHPFEDADDDGQADVLDPDDDNDGMPDWWEEANGLNPLNAADASNDPDGDGLTNLEEFQLGRDPNVFDLFFDSFESGDTSAWSLAT